VVTTDRRIVAYYCLAAGSIQPAAAPGNIKRNMPEPIPAIVMGRLAVDVTQHGKGVGADLLRHALEITTTLAQSAGIRALLVHAKDEAAAGFYKKFGFVPSPIDPLMLMVRV